MSRRHTTRSPSGETVSRRNRRFATCAAITATFALFGFTPKSNAAVVYSGVLNITGAVRTSIYTDFDAGVTQTTFMTGWDAAITLGIILPPPEVELSGSVPAIGGVNLGAFVGPGFSASKLDAGVTVDAASTFTYPTQPGFTMADNVNAFYPWNFEPTTGKFVGIEFKADDGKTHYAWERVNVDPTTLVPTVVDWAYESTPDTGIVTGDTGVSVPEPSSAALLGLLALGALGLHSRRRKTA